MVIHAALSLSQRSKRTAGSSGLCVIMPKARLSGLPALQVAETRHRVSAVFRRRDRLAGGKPQPFVVRFLLFFTEHFICARHRLVSKREVEPADDPLAGVTYRAIADGRAAVGSDSSACGGNASASRICSSVRPCDCNRLIAARRSRGRATSFPASASAASTPIRTISAFP